MEIQADKVYIIRLESLALEDSFSYINQGHSTMDPLPKPFQNACWIWDGSHFLNLHNAYVAMRRAFSLDVVPRKALVSVSADSRYKLYVNGQLVSLGPARGYQSHQPYDEVDLAPYLKPGKNALCAEAYNYGMSNFQYLTQQCAGFILGGKVGSVDLSTNGEWRVKRCAAHKQSSALLSITMAFQEHFDARLHDERWLNANFDDSAWSAPTMVPAGSMPWHSFEERSIPLLSIADERPPKLIAITSGKCAKGYAEAANVVAPFLAENRTWQPTVAKTSVRGSLLKFTLPASGKDRVTAYLLEFEEEVAGLPVLTIEGARGGEIVDVLLPETLSGYEPDFLPIEKTSCQESMSLRLIVREGKTNFESFHVIGFRYAAVIVRNSATPLTISLGLKSVRYPLEVKGAYNSDNAMLEMIYEISSRAQQLCMFDAYVDCPSREQVQWWGDALVQGNNTLYLSGDLRLFARGIRQIGAMRVPNGLTYGHAPTIGHHCILPDFTLLWLVTQHNYYAHTGDLSLFASMKSEVLETLHYFEGATQKNGLIPYDRRYWLFLDWAEIYRNGFPSVYNLLYLYTLRRMREMFEAIGDAAEAQSLDQRAQALEKAITKNLYDKKTKTVLAGLDEQGRPVRMESPHVAVWLMMNDLYPELHQKYLDDLLLPLIAGKREHPALPSPYFMYYYFEVLKQKGYGRQVLDCIERWWGDFIREGFTTTPEVWEMVRGFRSACHAWSAHPVVHLSNLHLGVTRRGIGWSEIDFAPVFHGAERVEGRSATPLGTIEVAWQLHGRKADVRLKLPKGITAHVKIPGHERIVTGRIRLSVDLN